MSREAARLEALYRRVAKRSPCRMTVSLLVLASGLCTGTALWATGRIVAGCAVLMVAAGAARAMVRWRGEVVRTGGLRWSHKARGVVEVELLGGAESWKEDLTRVARRSASLKDQGWRDLQVMMVTAVFPAIWLRSWGFSVNRCGERLTASYRRVYRLKWLEWSIQSRWKARRGPRYRRRKCVEARHGLGEWFDVIVSLPEGLRGAWTQERQ